MCSENTLLVTQYHNLKPSDDRIFTFDGQFNVHKYFITNLSFFECRELGSCGKNVILCEKDDVLLSGASSGNTGHLASNFYYRRHRALLEAEMAARARRINPDWISGQPSVPCIKTGMIYIARGQEDEAELEDMLMNAQLNGELGVRKISLEEVSRLEPSLNLSGVTGALYSDNEYIVDSWLLSMTHVYGMEVAGVVTMTSCHVTRVTRDGSIWKVDTSLGIFSAHCVINCAGNFGDTVESLAKNVKVELKLLSLIINISFLGKEFFCSPK